MSLISPDRHLQSRSSDQTNGARRRRSPLLSPALVEALNGLAKSEGLPLATLIALLIDEALTRRLRSRP